MNGVCASGRGVAAKVRAFTEFLKTEFEKIPALRVRWFPAQRSAWGGFARGEIQFDSRAARIEAEQLPDPGIGLPAQFVFHAAGLELACDGRQVRRGKRHVVEYAGRGFRQRPARHHM